MATFLENGRLAPNPAWQSLKCMHWANGCRLGWLGPTAPTGQAPPICALYSPQCWTGKGTLGRVWVIFDDWFCWKAKAVNNNEGFLCGAHVPIKLRGKGQGLWNCGSSSYLPESQFCHL